MYYNLHISTKGKCISINNKIWLNLSRLKSRFDVRYNGAVLCMKEKSYTIQSKQNELQMRHQVQYELTNNINFLQHDIGK